MTLDEMKSLPPEDQQILINRLTEIRRKYKATNYASTYGVREVTLSRQTGLPVKETKSLINSYWKRNWSLKKIATNTTIKVVRGRKWLYNPVSKLYYTLKYDKDVFSTLNQGTGVWCFDMWVEEYRKHRSQLTAQFHDETVQNIKLGFRKQNSKLLKDAIYRVNTKLNLNVTLDVDIQYGNRYSEIH